MARAELLVYSRHVGKKECSVLFEFDGHRWQPVNKTYNFDRASVAKGFRWGHPVSNKAVKAIQDCGAADAILEFPNVASAQKGSIADLSRSYRSEKYLIRIRGTESDRWFGPIDSEVLFSDSEVSLATLDKPDWTPTVLQEHEGLYVAPHRARLPAQKGTTNTTLLRAEIEGCLTKTRQEGVQTSLQWLPQAIQKSDPSIWIEPLIRRAESATSELSPKLADRLLESQLFAARFKQLEQSISAEAEHQARQLRTEVESLRAEQSELLKARLEITRDALKRIAEDEETLALAAILGAAFSQRPPQSPEPPKIDTDGLVRAITGRPTVDLAPLVGEISRLREEIRLDKPVADDTTHTSTAKVPSGRTLGRADEVAELGLSDAQYTLLTVAHAGFLPVAFGGQAAESVHRLLKATVASRATWWHCPADSIAATSIIHCAWVAQGVRQARDHPDRLFATVLEGIDRAPTEAYLEPLLVMRALDLPLPGDEQPWPSNLLIFATMTGGGQTVLPIAPGVWRRSIPVVADSHRVREATEIGAHLWRKTGDLRSEINLAGLLPAGIKPLNVDRLGQSAGHLGLSATLLLARGIAIASCLSRGDATKPLGEFDEFAPLLR